MRALRSVLVALTLLAATAVHAAPVRIVAAENFYGDIARQVGGAAVTVDSILTSPDADPHQFEASASVARKLADAQVVIHNGLGYDEWVIKLLSASRAGKRDVIEVAKLAGRKNGDNPHLWYDVSAVAALAETLTRTLARVDPAQQAQYTAGGAALARDLEGLKSRITALRAKAGRVPVTATEPVFGYMAEALGLEMRNMGFQLSVMNDTEPSASDIAAFEQDLRTKRVRMLIYNSQTTEGLTERLKRIAQTAGVPVVGVTETLPAGLAYTAWMHRQLDAVQQALEVGQARP